MLTIHDDSDHVFSILEAGADAYLTKKVFGDEVIHAVTGVARGDTILGGQSSKKILKEALANIARATQPGTGERLTYRDIEMLKLLANGRSNRDISDRLSLSLRTVKNYLVGLFGKMDVSSRTEAVITALKSGVISLEDIE